MWAVAGACLPQALCPGAGSVLPPWVHLGPVLGASACYIQGTWGHGAPFKPAEYPVVLGNSDVSNDLNSSNLDLPLIISKVALVVPEGFAFSAFGVVGF